jgi:hypothetical protein
MLEEVGFDAFTGRNAWRYVGEDVDAVNFQSFGGMLADSVGCTSSSFQRVLRNERHDDAHIWFVVRTGRTSRNASPMLSR